MTAVIVWAVAVLAVWVVVAAVVGILLGRVIRNRERQAPRPPRGEETP